MDAETWGGEVAEVYCLCGMTAHKAKTQARTSMYCPCGLAVITSEHYAISLTARSIPMTTDRSEDEI